MQTETQEQMPQNYGTVPNAVNLPPKTTAQTEMQQNNINLPPAVENGLQGQNKNISIREQIKNNIDELKKMQAVSAVNPDTLKPGESGFMGNVINYFKSLGNIIRRPGFGDVIINERHLKGTLKYFPNKAEMAAFTAIPDVIRSGKQIYYNENQKSRGYASYTFAAPITIGNDTGIMAVVVTRPNESNYYKIHRVLTPDGKEFLLDTEKTLPVKNAGGKTVDTAITEAPISDNSVPQSPAEVKSNKPQNVMETVKDINRPTQQETGSQGQETGARKSVRELVGTIDNSSYNIPKISTPKDVYIDDNGNPLPQSKYPSAIRKYMLKLFRGKVLKIGKDHKVYVSKEGVEEFAFPVKRLSSDIKLAKYDAGANLDKTLEPAMFLVNVADDGSHPKATGGWDNFYVMFETESGIYSGIVKTMMTDRGRVFYDITEMQKEDVSRATRGDNEINSSPAMPGTSSELSVPQSPAEIKSNQPQNVTETVNIPTQQETGSQGQEIAEGLISKIEQSIPLLKHTQPVSKLSGQEFQKVEGKSLVEQVSGFFKSIGNKVANPQLGEVILNERGIKDSIAHGLGRIKAAAFLAVPDVIKGGEIVETQRQWKGRLYDTAVIVAPVEIGDDLHHVGVVVIKNPDNNRYYLHEVVSKKRRFNTVQDRAGK